MLVSKWFTVPEYIKKCGTRYFWYWGVGSIDDVRLICIPDIKHKKKERIVILSF
ncbi:hypothetical protein C7475_102490 [Chitinophaga sp. S165]|nr:hypothetical protein C7475_102490 [Chitinophaga sp. S165]